MKKPLETFPAVLTKWSGRRDSNSRRPPWQGGALPTELRPQIRVQGVGSAPRPSTAIFAGVRARVPEEFPGGKSLEIDPAHGPRYFESVSRSTSRSFSTSL